MNIIIENGLIMVLVTDQSSERFNYFSYDLKLLEAGINNILLTLGNWYKQPLHV